MKILLVDCDEGGEITSLLYENKNCAARITDVVRAQQFDVPFINLLVPSLTGVELSGPNQKSLPRTCESS